MVDYRFTHKKEKGLGKLRLAAGRDHDGVPVIVLYRFTKSCVRAQVSMLGIGKIVKGGYTYFEGISGSITLMSPLSCKDCVSLWARIAWLSFATWLGLMAIYSLSLGRQ